MKNYITTERTNLFEPNSTITMKFSIEGPVTNNEIETAIYMAIQANQILNTKIVLSSDGQAWYEKNENQQNKVILSDKPWEAIYHEQIKIRFRIEEGELIRVFILQEGEKKQILILAHHLAGDGKSIVYFIEDIMNALSGKKILYKKMRLLSIDNIPGRNKMLLLMGMYVNYYNYAWKRKGEVFSIDDSKKIHDIYWEQHKTALRIEHFSSEEQQGLVKKAKEAKVTLTSYIVTAFCEARPGRISTGLAVDGRMDHNRNMGNQATGISVDYRYNKKCDFSQNARCIQKKLDKKLICPWKKYFVLNFMGALSGTLIDSIYMYLSGIYKNKKSAELAKALGYSKSLRDISITNLTRLDIPYEYGSCRISNFIFVPPIISYGKRLIGIATLGDEMYITYHLMEDDEIDSEVNYFNKVMERLKK